jgi:SAM-dependent methyltransferase
MNDMNLIWLNFRTRFRMFVEYLNVIWTDYRKTQYMKADLKLLSRYVFDNPFSISKQYAVEHDDNQIYTYGETPIPALRKIVKECEIDSRDVVYELGCGRGRACLWLRHIIGCQVTGVECIGEFIRRATDLQDEKLTFIEEDFLETNLEDATVIYLNGTMLSRLEINKLAEKLRVLPASVTIITVSYPLTHYSPTGSFTVKKEFPVTFHWGTASVYLQTTRKH